MTGKNIGLAEFLQKERINCRMFHCIVHQEALCGLTLKRSGQSLQNNEKYPKKRDFGLQIISMFGSTCSCERAMKYIKSKFRNCLKDSTLENIISVATVNIDMDIKEIVAQQLRSQCSH